MKERSKPLKSSSEILSQRHGYQIWSVISFSITISIEVLVATMNQMIKEPEDMLAIASFATALLCDRHAMSYISSKSKPDIFKLIYQLSTYTSKAALWRGTD